MPMYPNPADASRLQTPLQTSDAEYDYWLRKTRSPWRNMLTDWATAPAQYQEMYPATPPMPLPPDPARVRYNPRGILTTTPEAPMPWEDTPWMPWITNYR